MNTDARKDLTCGSIPLKILGFALPIFFGQVLQQFYNMADAWVIGNFASNDAFAAVSSGGNLIFLLIGFFNGIGVGGGVVIARYFGSGDTGNLKIAIHSDFLFGLIASLAGTIFGLAAIPKILVLMQTPESVLPYSLRYFRIYCSGMATIVLYNTCMAMMQALGDSVRPLQYLFISTLINLVLDLVFVAGLHWDVAGAAAATVIAQGISVGLCIRRLKKDPNPDLRLEMRQLRWNGQMIRRILKQGLPTGIQNSVISLGNLVIQSNINSFGAFAMSGHGAYTKIEGLAFLSVISMSTALPTFVSQNLGAGKHDRAKKGSLFGILAGMGAAALTGIALYIWTPQMLRFFVDSEESIAYGITHGRIVTVFYALLAMAHCCAGVLRGCGKSTIPMVVMLSFWCVVRSIYVTVILKFIPEFRMISWAYPLTWSLSCIVFLICLLRMDWNKIGENI